MFSQFKKELCPLVKAPLSECYCFDMDSGNINPAIMYCSNDYKSCSIFKQASFKGKLNEAQLKRE